MTPSVMKQPGRSGAAWIGRARPVRRGDWPVPSLLGADLVGAGPRLPSGVDIHRVEAAGGGPWPPDTRPYRSPGEQPFPLGRAGDVIGPLSVCARAGGHLTVPAVGERVDRPPSLLGRLEMALTMNPRNFHQAVRVPRPNGDPGWGPDARTPADGPGFLPASPRDRAPDRISGTTTISSLWHSAALPRARFGGTRQISVTGRTGFAFGRSPRKAVATRIGRLGQVGTSPRARRSMLGWLPLTGRLSIIGRVRRNRPGRLGRKTIFASPPVDRSRGLFVALAGVRMTSGRIPRRGRSVENHRCCHDREFGGYRSY